MSEISEEERIEIPDLLPVLPLKDVVVFPYIIVPLSVGRDGSVEAVDRALTEHRIVMLVTQRNPEVEEPGPEELYDVGTAASIMRMLKLPDGRIRILVQGLARARIERYTQETPLLLARVRPLSLRLPPSNLETEALVRSARENLDRIVHLGKNVSSEVMIVAANLEDPGRLADLAASNLDLKSPEAQSYLEEEDVVRRLRRVNEALIREIQLLTMQQEISSQARDEMDRTQREYFLRQQLRAIQQELGEGDELAEEIAAYREAALEKGLTEEAREEVERQSRRLERSHPDSAEAALTRTYLDWLTGLPWGCMSDDRLDLDNARKILDRDHFDLERIKERILEYLAVRQLNPAARGPILCFVGPPGVGKTSLGRSIAEALGRRFVRISLGGVRDEAEIRGHRRTYVGALPGRIVQGINQAETSNPVFMLDEIDKIGSDYRGDPSSALLEVLDPEQNWSFRDHYLGVTYDLSNVMFIATANLLEPIQPAFRDRMEVLSLSGYTEAEKVQIARRHLIPKLRSDHGLSSREIVFGAPAIRKIVREYTKEAGVRNLERELASVCRKIAVRVARGESKRWSISARRIEELLGPARHYPEELLDRDRVGVATGLAWTASGGDLLFIEVAALSGKGRLLLTGSLGDVMKESAQAALSFARSYAEEHAIDADFFAQRDIHVHVPAGSIPKDGPSAGITIASALVSVLTGRPVRRRVAMSGEITLRGDVLPVGGLKEKLLAARAAGVRTLVFPRLNRRDVAEIPDDLRQGLDVRYVEHVEEALSIALIDQSGEA